jgi:hypothetical protein
MIDDIEKPVAHAVVTWASAEMGGRKSGPPTAPVYAATCTFVHGGDAEIQPDWPAQGEHFSILIQRTETLPGGAWICKIDFLVRDLVAPSIHLGALLLIMEGGKVVGTAAITAVA